MNKSVPHKNKVSRSIKFIISLKTEVNNGTIFGFKESFYSSLLNIIIYFESISRFGYHTKYLFRTVNI